MIYHYFSLHLYTAKNQTKIYHGFHFYSNNFILFYSQFSQFSKNINNFYKNIFIHLTYYWVVMHCFRNPMFLHHVLKYAYFIKMFFIFIFLLKLFIKILILCVSLFYKQKRKI